MPRKKGKRSQAGRDRRIKYLLAKTGSIDAASVDTQPPPLEHEDSQPETPRSCQRVESVQASHCQSDQRYSKFSRNHQCSCMALTFLAYHSEGWQFDAAFLDKVLAEGDALYVTVKNQLLSDGSYVHDHLAVEEMPSHILTDRDVYYVRVSSVRCGHLKAEEDGPGDWFPLAAHLQCLLTDVSLALLIVAPDCIALFRDSSGRYGVFDSHSRSAAGLPHADGSAVMLTFTHLRDLIDHLHQLFRRCGDDVSYEFVPISFESVTNSSAELRVESAETYHSNIAADMADQTAAAKQTPKRQTRENKETRLKRKRLATKEYLKDRYARCAEFRTKKLQASKKYASLRKKMLMVKNYYADTRVRGHLNGAHHVCRTCYTKIWSE